MPVDKLTGDDQKTDPNGVQLAKINEVIDAVNAGGAGAAPSNSYASTELEWIEEFLWQGTLSQNGGWDQLPIFPNYGLRMVGSGTDARIDSHNGGTERIGVIEMETGTATDGACAIRTEISSCNFSQGEWTYEVVFGLTGPVSDATDQYAVVIGFAEQHTLLDQARGNYFLYDSEDSAIGGANPSQLNKWQCVSAFGALAADKTVTLTNVDVAAVTWPDTNV